MNITFECSKCEVNYETTDWENERFNTLLKSHGCHGELKDHWSRIIIVHDTTIEVHERNGQTSAVGNA